LRAQYPLFRFVCRFAQIAHVFAHAHRLELLKHLGLGERSVEDLATRASLPLANASSFSAAPPSTRADATASTSTIGTLATKWWWVCSLPSAASASATVPRSRGSWRSYFRARDEFEPVFRQELLKRPAHRLRDFQGHPSREQGVSRSISPGRSQRADVIRRSQKASCSFMLPRKRRKLLRASAPKLTSLSWTLIGLTGVHLRPCRNWIAFSENLPSK
jgi:hypothetical protein